MKVAFILLELSPGQLRHFNFAIGALSASLKRAGHETSLLHYVSPMSAKEMAKSISAESPDIVAFTVATNVLRHLKEISHWLKQHFDIPIICGGVHATLAPESVISDSSIDIICVGEGDEAIVDLCNKMQSDEDITSIPNLWIKKDGELFRNSPRPLLENLDLLPFQDRQVFDYQNLAESKNRVAKVTASRGCPYNCTYCCNQAIRGIYRNRSKYTRFRSVDNVLTEVEKIIETFPFIEFLVFHDDILPLKLDWLRQFAGEYRKRIGLPFRCNYRPDLMSKEVAQLLRQAGCIKVNMAIEAGNEYIRNEVLNRRVNQSQIIEAFALCRKEGIATQSFNMVGLPFESPGSILETIKLNAQINPDIIWRSIFYPYPKTKLHEICEERGFITKREYDTFTEGTILSQPTVSETQVNFAYHFFYLLAESYIALAKLPSPLRTFGERTLDSFFTSRIVPHSLLVALKKAAMYLLYKLAYYLRHKRSARLYSLLMALRAKKESRLRIVED